jgi:dephospho-CoA kinase
VPAERFPIVGLTGGIASGKSTVAGWFKDWGGCVVDADQIARDVAAIGGRAYDDIVKQFGPEILSEDRSIVRPKLGAIVFNDSAARRQLEEIMHPAIRHESASRFDRCAASGDCSLGFYDAALLVETGIHESFDWLIVVACSVETQLQRIQVRDGLDSAAGRARIEAQLPLEQKVALADYVIDSDRTLDEMRQRAREVWDEINRLVRERPRHP